MSDDSAYNSLPYNFHADIRTHPARIATLGHFYGMSPKPLEQSRILDIGCAEGANVLPIAENYPNCKIIAFDNAKKQIETANRIKGALGLTNIDFFQADIAKPDLGDEPFDYILAHGFLSWIPRHLHSCLFKCIKRYLAPQGIALVTFNTYPGWHSKWALRDFLLTYTDANKPLPERAKEAKHLIDKVLQQQHILGSAFINAHKATLEDIQKRPINYIAHDYLSTENIAYYFKDFMHFPREHGLQFLGDTELKRDITYQENDSWRNFGIPYTQTLEDAHQRLDFFKNYPCRLTLLCHEGIQLCEHPKPSAITPVHLTSYLRLPSSVESFSPEADLSFKSASHAVCPEAPECKALLWALYKSFPKSMPASQLITEVHRLTAPVGSLISQEALLKHAQNIFVYYSLNQIELWTTPPHVVDTVSSKPTISRLNRYLAQNTTHSLINQHHIVVSMLPHERTLAAHLDGTHTQEALKAKLGWDNQQLSKVLETLRICAFLTE